MSNLPVDSAIRMGAFRWLERQIAIHGEVLDYRLLQKGFQISGHKVSLVSMQGIFRPAMMETPLSIRTAFAGPYNDSFGKDGLLRYRYRGTDWAHPENVGLRTAWKQRIPLIYFHGVLKGKYLAAWPVYIVDDDRRNLTFTIAVDDVATIKLQPGEEPQQELRNDDNSFARRGTVRDFVCEPLVD
jgi:putative restriction endonuclease